jgi:hypothetical protein
LQWKGNEQGNGKGIVSIMIWDKNRAFEIIAHKAEMKVAWGTDWLHHVF